jgi:hypothetical protein
VSEDEKIFTVDFLQVHSSNGKFEKLVENLPLYNNYKIDLTSSLLFWGVDQI